MGGDWSDRKLLFSSDQRYRVRADFPQQTPFELRKGDVLTFRGVQYSHYDSCHIYQFEHSNGTSAALWLHDGTAPETIQRLFDPLP
jgi:hypothetical protein